MLVCMGRNVVIDLDSESIELPERWGMLYDPSGEFWPKRSILFAQFEQGTDADGSDVGKRYFGRWVEVRRGRVTLPPRNPEMWKRIGQVRQVYYERAGKNAGYFRHRFNDPRGWVRLVAFFKKDVAETPPVLFRCAGEALKLELSTGCIVDDRGIVLP